MPATTLTRDQLEEKLSQLSSHRYVAERSVRYHRSAAALDYFGREEFDPDFLPWPRNAE